jgi:hypothetical protein
VVNGPHWAVSDKEETMTLATRIGRTIALVVVVFGIAVPVATAGVDRGIGTEPHTTPVPDAVDRALANDRAHASVPDRYHPGGLSAAMGRSQTDTIWNARLVGVGVGAGALLVLGSVGTVLVMRRRVRLVA